MLLAIDAAIAGGLYLAEYSVTSCLIAAGAFWALLVAAFAFFVKFPVRFFFLAFIIKSMSLHYQISRTTATHQRKASRAILSAMPKSSMLAKSPIPRTTLAFLLRMSRSRCAKAERRSSSEDGT